MSSRNLVRAVGALGAVRRNHRQPAYRHGVPGDLGKDFSVVPVCGSVRPLVDQRSRSHLAG